MHKSKGIKSAPSIFTIQTITTPIPSISPKSRRNGITHLQLLPPLKALREKSAYIPLKKPSKTKTHSKQPPNTLIRRRRKIVNVAPNAISLSNLQLLTQKRDHRTEWLGRADLEARLLQPWCVTEGVEIYGY